MAEVKHGSLQPGAASGIHASQSWEVADQAARLALVVSASDEGKICRQLSDGSFWVLADSATATWRRIDNEAVVVNPSVWKIALDLNLTLEPSQPFVDGTQTWRGLTVIGKNIASGASQAGVVNGLGLAITANSTSTDLSPSGDTGPYVRIPLSELCPGLLFGSTRARFSVQWRMLGADADYEIAQWGLRRAWVSTNNEHTFKFTRGFNSAAGGASYHYAWYGYSTNVSSVQVPATYNVACIETNGPDGVWHGRATAQPLSDSNAAVFGDLALLSFLYRVQGPTAVQPVIAKASDIFFFTGVMTGNASRNIQVVLERLRVEYLA